MNDLMPIDSKTFDRLYRNHVRAVESVVRSFRFHDAACDDLVQEVFAKAWDKRDNLRDVRAFSGWLMQIARNTCLNEWKKARPTISLSGTDGLAEDEESPALVLAAPDESEAVEREYSLALIRYAIVHHKHETRALIAQRFYCDEWSVERISESLGMKTNTVLSHLHRFRIIVTRAVAGLLSNHDVEFESTRRKLLRA